MVRPEEIATRSIDESHDEPASAQAALNEHPMAANTTAVGKKAQEDIEPPYPGSAADQITAVNERAETPDAVSNMSPPIHVTGRRRV